MKESDIKQYLEQFAHERPDTVMAKLNPGDTVRKSAGLEYEIDDVAIYKRLGDFQAGAVPYGKIYHALEPSKGKIIQSFKNSNKLPYSEIFEKGIGECLEKAILVQLAAQTGRDAFLINGLLGMEENGIEPIDWHAYNIVFKEGKPYLIDTQNPLRVDETGKVTHPYIAPVLGISEGEFQVPPEWKQGRTYALW